jgi:uncharacterized membrane protein (DUF2068 family)
MAKHTRRGLVFIGCFKLIKAALLVLVGCGLVSMALHGQATAIGSWIADTRVDPNNRIVHAVIAKLLGVRRRSLEALSFGTFVYAAVFTVEGLGLLMAKKWAEYLTLAVTISFLPIEVYEMVERPNVLKACTITVNVAVVVYLWRTVRQKKH